METDQSKIAECERLALRLKRENPSVLFISQIAEEEDGRRHYFVSVETFLDPPPALIGIPAGWLVYNWYRGEVENERYQQEDDD